MGHGAESHREEGPWAAPQKASPIRSRQEIAVHADRVA